MLESFKEKVKDFLGKAIRTKETNIKKQNTLAKKKIKKSKQHPPTN